MYPSATLCRTQQAIHLDRAASATLANVRAVAEKAAKAWGIEAIAAEDREARGERVRAHRLANPVTALAGDEEQSLEDWANDAAPLPPLP